MIDMHDKLETWFISGTGIIVTDVKILHYLGYDVDAIRKEFENCCAYGRYPTRQQIQEAIEFDVPFFDPGKEIKVYPNRHVIEDWVGRAQKKN